jgi:uncharacterized membrane protein
MPRRTPENKGELAVRPAPVAHLGLREIPRAGWLHGMESTAVHDRLFSKHRLEMLSDGVFAVVMTLLVLEIKPGLSLHSDNAAVANALEALGRPLVSYGFAFFLTAIFWTLHHRKFLLLRLTDTPHTALTFAFLFGVSLLPFSLSIFLSSMNSSIAEALYFANFTLIAATLLAGWLYAQKTGLTVTDVPPQTGKALTQRMTLMTISGLIGTVASYFAQRWIFLLLLVVLIWGRIQRRRLEAP